MFFFVDSSPYALLFGARGHSFAFELAVKNGYWVDTSLPPDEYSALCKVLGLKYDPTNPFSLRAFVGEFAQTLPSRLPQESKVKPHQLAQYRPDVERAEGFCFCGWRDNTARGETVTDRNLQKTRSLLGEKIFKTCAIRNLSSCWTDDPDDPRVKRYEQQGYEP